MAESKHTYWSRQIDGLARELSRLAIACDIELGKDDKKTPDGPVLG
jgi:hypothetical protein